MNTSREDAVKTQAADAPKTSNDTGHLHTTTAIVGMPQESFGIKGALADPEYSGFGTWLGTIISIIAAIVAFRQARTALSVVRGMQIEQKRQYIENAHRAIARLDQVVKPIVLNGVPLRGVDATAITGSANEICHQLLSMPLDKIVPEISDSVRSIEGFLSNIVAEIKSAKANPTTIDPLCDLQKSIRSEIQLLLRTCTDYLDQNAVATR